MIIPKSNISLLHVACAVGETATAASVKVNLQHPDGTTEEVTYSNCKCLDTRLSSVNLSDNVNLFAKYKPMYTPYAPGETENWWKGDDGKCGIYIPTFTSRGSLDEVVNFIKSNPTWVRNKPAGGQYFPYRLGFFSGYDTHAAPFFYLNLDGTPLLIYMNLTTTLTIKAYSKVNSSDTGLRWTDFDAGNLNLNKCYLGVYIENRDNPTHYLFCTSEATIDSTDSEIVIRLNEGDTFYEGVYDIYLFLSSQIIRQGENDSINDPSTDGYRYYPIYTGDLKNYPIQLTYTTSFTINFLINSVDEVASSDSYSTMNFQPISRYGSYDAEALQIRKYTLFKITVQNKNTTAISINKSEIVIGLANHLGEYFNISSQQVVGKPYLYLMTDALNAVNEVSIPGSATQTIIVCIADLILGGGDDLDATMVWDLTFGNMPEDYDEQDFYPFVSQSLKLYV